MTLQPADVVMMLGLVTAAGIDARTGRIPNVVTVPMMALGIVIHATTGADPWLGLVGCAAGFALHFLLFALGVEKAGDAKLMMGVGACFGWRGMVETSIWTAFVYLPVGLGLLAVQGKLPNLLAAGRYALAKARGQDPGPAPEPTMLRTGPIILVGGVLAWATPWLDKLI